MIDNIVFALWSIAVAWLVFPYALDTLLLMLAAIRAVAVWLYTRRKERQERIARESKNKRAELILEQAATLLQMLLASANRPEDLTVLEVYQEQWATRIIANINAYKPDLCRTNTPLQTP